MPQNLHKYSQRIPSYNSKIVPVRFVSPGIAFAISDKVIPSLCMLVTFIAAAKVEAIIMMTQKYDALKAGFAMPCIWMLKLYQ